MILVQSFFGHIVKVGITVYKTDYQLL